MCLQMCCLMVLFCLKKLLMLLGFNHCMMLFSSEIYMKTMAELKESGH